MLGNNQPLQTRTMVASKAPAFESMEGSFEALILGHPTPHQNGLGTGLDIVYGLRLGRQALESAPPSHASRASTPPRASESTPPGASRASESREASRASRASTPPVPPSHASRASGLGRRRPDCDGGIALCGETGSCLRPGACVQARLHHNQSIPASRNFAGFRHKFSPQAIFRGQTACWTAAGDFSPWISRSC
jgi:hypothetical protein